ncbi:DUF2213 domain-containing protein [Delftia tsuruhatensis]|uniref:DUF2213 domain-containing protein n=1 Tax=Delftia tsuruhatensis TaxID=180282 RepID=UPI0024447E48|nr:DUF2213 domain-containing protein [Delftia tsuruhatensis]MDH0777528.1 DUF2213 domain-containing protein [Delftia tsuruhatensis]MDH1461864.1 DUF2213 domain-containing protein [Delftia tsuruhatensis]WGG09957.1 DUF2213 domain-containing protein [Delftia tsuruhatensis]
MSIKFTDRVAVGELKETREGYLVATARVARTGVQLYLASELGDVARGAGFRPGDVVRVYRHADEVFAKDSLASITRLPVTVDHPAEEVTSENWQQLAVGEVGDAYATEPEWIVVNPMIKDAGAAKAARTTHQEISMGYSAAIVPARDGLEADFEQRGIRYNHLALVPKGRAGEMARIGDSWGASPVQDFQPGISPKSKGGLMPDMKTVVLGDKAVQVADTDVALIEQYKTDMARKLTDAESKHAAAIAAKDEDIGKLRADLATAQAAANIDVDSLVAARSELVGQVKAMDSSIDPKGKTDAELRKAAVLAKLGDSIVKDASDAEITGMFKALAKDAATTNPVATALRHGVVNVGDAQSLADKALAKANTDLNAWRNQ